MLLSGDEEGIGLALFADGGGDAVARVDHGVVRQLHEFAAERVHNLLHGATPEIGAADAAGEKHVTGKELGIGQHEIDADVWEIQADAARRVTRSVNHFGFEETPAERVAFFEKVIDCGEFRGSDAEKRGLHVHALVERKIFAMHEHWRSGEMVELGQAADVVDVGVGADDGFCGKAVATEELEDAADFVTGIDDDGLARNGIADDGAIALQHADRNGDLDDAVGIGIERL